ncbi:hypothetical protein [Ekhidna sp. To15]|uniref:hypothetical protein n=1 Tax=Ekhidna sp. To15 TaxID=3395267 RepID=UPI003F521B3C
MKIQNRNIAVTSNEPWGDIWYSKQNYAFELSRNNRVIFINPPTKWRLTNLFDSKVVINKVSDQLSTLDYGNWIPTRWKLTNFLNNLVVSRRIKKVLKNNEFEKFIFWAFDPTRLYDPQILGADVSVYHCVDYYYFQYYGEKQLCRKSDYLFATSQLFLDEFNEFEKPKHVVPHGISQDEFELDPTREKELNISHSSFGLYLGVIDHRMDFEFYEQVIQKFPEQLFVFVGPVRETNNEAFDRIFKEQKYENVILTGPVHFKDLKYYISKASFCMSFMNMNYHANTVHHHKTLVYLAQGKPVFSFEFEEYKKNKDIMYLSNDYDELINELSSFLKSGETQNVKDQRISYAKKYTFQSILDQAGSILLS